MVSIFLNNMIRSLWPIRNNELSRFIPMSFLMFLILFTQNILRVLKDTVLITETEAQVIAFAKIYCITPAAAIFIIIYAKMINHFSFSKIFYYLTVGFISYFLIFAFLFYPNIEFFHCSKSWINNLTVKYPYLKWYLTLVGNWSYILFYTLSELWPNIFYILLFWQLANSITNKEEAARFYTLFSLFGNSSLVVVGLLLMNLSSEHTILRHFFENANNKLILIQASTILISFCSILSCLLVKQITKKETNRIKKINLKSITQKKMTLSESFKYISTSSYLWLMLICSAAFGLVMNLVEAVWKSKIKDLYPSMNEYAYFNSLCILWTGIAIMLITVVGNNLVRIYGWFFAAVIPPIIIAVTGLVFFMLIIFDKNIVSYLDNFILISPLLLAVIIGAVQNILAKGAKYALTDPLQQMLYQPLDEELKTKGKAAVDLLSTKIGKGSSGLFLSMIFTFMPHASFNSISPVLSIIFAVVCVAWIISLKKIHLRYKELT